MVVVRWSTWSRWLPVAEVWFLSEFSQVERVLRHAFVARVLQASPQVGKECERRGALVRPFITAVVDLTMPEAALWRQCDPKSCRYEINRARKFGVKVGEEEATEEVRHFLNHHIVRTGYRRPIGVGEFKAVTRRGRVTVARLSGEILAAHVLVQDYPKRVRLLMSAISSKQASDERRLAIGPANRYLHWWEFEWFKCMGYRYYDFGGIMESGTAKQRAITKFKLSFGGQREEGVNIWIARGRIGNRFLAKYRELRGG